MPQDRNKMASPGMKSKQPVQPFDGNATGRHLGDQRNLRDQQQRDIDKAFDPRQLQLDQQAAFQNIFGARQQANQDNYNRNLNQAHYNSYGRGQAGATTHAKQAADLHGGYQTQTAANLTAALAAEDQVTNNWNNQRDAALAQVFGTNPFSDAGAQAMQNGMNNSALQTIGANQANLAEFNSDQQFYNGVSGSIGGALSGIGAGIGNYNSRPMVNEFQGIFGVHNGVPGTQIQQWQGGGYQPYSFQPNAFGG
jgi:hypothetical protein